jgi:hypothetical protein
MTGYIMRLESGGQGTFGRLLAPGFDCHTLEPPWRDNRPNISCIPAGTYRAVVRQSPRFGTVYHVTDVSGRSWILTHSGNLGGDESEGWKSHTEGCILLGGYRGALTVRGRAQRAVLYSRPTFDRFMEAMGGGEFTLKIMEAWK